MLFKNRQVHYFVYNESNQIVGEYDSNGNVIQEYVYFGLRSVAVKNNGNLNIVHTDYLGTPRVVTSGLNDWMGRGKTWETALLIAGSAKMHPLKDKCGNEDKEDADNRTAAEHYIFVRSIGNTKNESIIKRIIAYGYNTVDWLAPPGYQGIKFITFGVFGTTSKASMNQIKWELKSWSDAVFDKKYYKSKFD